MGWGEQSRSCGHHTRATLLSNLWAMLNTDVCITMCKKWGSGCDLVSSWTFLAFPHCYQAAAPGISAMGLSLPCHGVGWGWPWLQHLPQTFPLGPPSVNALGTFGLRTKWRSPGFKAGQEGLCGVLHIKLAGPRACAGSSGCAVTLTVPNTPWERQRLSNVSNGQ